MRPRPALGLARRHPRPGLVHHSDRGSHYASAEYRAILAAHGMIPSMSRVGSCWDNAVAESFFASLKVELDYIELFYNTQRRHSTLGQLSPRAFERQWRHTAQ